MLLKKSGKSSAFKGASAVGRAALERKYLNKAHARLRQPLKVLKRLKKVGAQDNPAGLFDRNSIEPFGQKELKKERTEMQFERKMRVELKINRDSTERQRAHGFISLKAKLDQCFFCSLFLLSRRFVVESFLSKSIKAATDAGLSKKGRASLLSNSA
jgi:hypothetical protein